MKTPLHLTYVLYDEGIISELLLNAVNFICKVTGSRIYLPYYLYFRILSLLDMRL